MNAIVINPDDEVLPLPLPDYCVVKRATGHIDVLTVDRELFLFTIPAEQTFKQPLLEQIVRMSRVYQRGYQQGAADGKRLLQVELRAILGDRL